MSNENEKKEFDPTESEEFYQNLENVLGISEEDEIIPDYIEDELQNIQEKNTANVQENVSESEEEILPELVFTEDLFVDEEDGDAFEMGLAATEENKFNKFRMLMREIPTWTKVLAVSILVILISVGLLFGTKAGRGLIYDVIAEIALGQITLVPDPTEVPLPTDTPVPTPTLTPVPTPTPALTGGATGEITETPLPTATNTPKPTYTPTPTPSKILDDENIINILLLGEENMDGSERGRTDTIMLVSINKNGGNLKLVSFLRDSYVRIPGYRDNRLNAAYTNGGAELVMKTLEENFRIDIDSYVLIDFEGFEAVIDMLGGLRISLTAAESKYLNSTNYISNKNERNTVTGPQLMTGSQVLGYCRIRKVYTENGLYNDQGRTYRQRVVLQALFDKYKEKSLSELVGVMSKCFGYVTAPTSIKKLAGDCLQAVVENQMFTIDTLQIPKKGHFHDETVRDMAVLILDLDNKDILQEFLYGQSQ